MQSHFKTLKYIRFFFRGGGGVEEAGKYSLKEQKTLNSREQGANIVSKNVSATSPELLVGKSAGLVIERLRVRIPAGEFASPELSLCVHSSYSVPVPSPVLPQWHVKDLGHPTKSAGGRLHLNMHTALTQRSLSGMTILLSRHSEEAYSETNSHLTCQETFGHSRLSSLSHCGLILA